MRYEVGFFPADKQKFYNLIILLLVWVARYVQSTQSDKFTIYLENVKDEVDFLQAHKHESLPKNHTMILKEMVKHSQSSQNINFVMSL